MCLHFIAVVLHREPFFAANQHFVKRFDIVLEKFDDAKLLQPSLKTRNFERIILAFELIDERLRLPFGGF
jgi:hypothetical protein